MGLLREIFRLNCHGNLLTELLYIDLREVLRLFCRRRLDDQLLAGVDRGQHGSLRLHIPGPAVPAAEACAVQSRHNLVQCLIEIGGAGDDIGQIQNVVGIFLRIRQTQDTAQDLLHIHGGGSVRNRGEDVGKGAVLALLQGVDRDDVADGTVGGPQIHALQLVLVRRLDGDVACGDTGTEQLVLDLLISGAVSLGLGLGLDEDNGADIAFRLLLIQNGLGFQVAAHIDGIAEYIVLGLIEGHPIDTAVHDHILLIPQGCVGSGGTVLLVQQPQIPGKVCYDIFLIGFFNSIISPPRLE